MNGYSVKVSHTPSKRDSKRSRMDCFHGVEWLLWSWNGPVILVKEEGTGVEWLGCRVEGGFAGVRSREMILTEDE
jgi:hypothetical protein